MTTKGRRRSTSLSEVSWIRRRGVTREHRILFPSFLEAAQGPRVRRDEERQHGWKRQQAWKQGIDGRRKEEGVWGTSGARLGYGHKVAAWCEYRGQIALEGTESSSLGHSRDGWRARLIFLFISLYVFLAVTSLVFLLSTLFFLSRVPQPHPRPFPFLPAIHVPLPTHSQHSNLFFTPRFFFPTDYAKGFGGQYGIQKDRVDKVNTGYHGLKSVS